MRRQLAARCASALLTLLGASLLVFAALDRLPGNAAAVLLGTSARPDTVAALERQLGLDRPAPERYLRWIGGALEGDLGRSATYDVPVATLIAERLAVTLPLAAFALLLAVAAGVPLGVMAGGRPGGLVDRGAALFASLGIAVPDFWFGILLVLVFSTGLHWFAAGGFPGWEEPAGAIRALLLPAVALGLPQAGVLVRVTRAAVREVAGEDFVRTARAKGLSKSRILWRHVARNALPPVVTVIGLQASFLIAGAVLVENVFALPGLGRLAFQALAQRDLAVIRGVAMLFAALVIAANLAADLATTRLDPRLRGG